MATAAQADAAAASGSGTGPPGSLPFSARLPSPCIAASVRYPAILRSAASCPVLGSGAFMSISIPEIAAAYALAAIYRFSMWSSISFWAARALAVLTADAICWPAVVMARTSRSPSSASGPGFAVRSAKVRYAPIRRLLALRARRLSAFSVIHFFNASAPAASVFCARAKTISSYCAAAP